MSDVAVIYTECTKEDDPIGGTWSAQPFAMRHVAWVPSEDFDAAIDTIREIKTAAARGHTDEVMWLCCRALAHLENNGDSAGTGPRATPTQNNGGQP